MGLHEALRLRPRRISSTAAGIDLVTLPDPRYLNAIFQMASDHEVSRYLEWSPHETIADTQFFFDVCQGDIDRRTGFHFAVLEGGVAKGVIGLFAIDEFRERAEMGSWLGRAFWGQRLKNRSQALLLEYAFANLELAKIVFRVAVGNQRSVAAHRRWSTVLEGTLRHDLRTPNGLMDAHCYGLLREDYLRQTDRAQIQVVLGT